MIRENRYIVLKNTDVESGLTETEQQILNALCSKVSQYRKNFRQLPLECVVVESDWPEYEPTWAAIEKRVDASTTRKDNQLSQLISTAGQLGMGYLYKFTGGEFSGLIIASDAYSPKRLVKYLGYSVLPITSNTASGIRAGFVMDNDKFTTVCVDDVERV